MASIITLAGERLFAAKAQANEQLDIDTFIFANVPNQDPTAPINREEALPAEHEVHRQAVQQVGRINDNVVVYSTVLDSVTGSFDFNWVGLYSSANQTLVAINHVPTVTKTVTAPGVAGNTLNRNFGIEYSGVADLTGIDVKPETWQLDFTARLSGMDELTRQLAKDLNGKDWFIDDGFKVEPRSTVNTFRVVPGVGYVSGLRVELENEHILTVQTYPQFVYVDAWFDGDANSIWKPQTAFTVTNGEMDDYVDPQGRQHYVYKLAVIKAADDVEDLREEIGLVQKQTVSKAAVLAKNSLKKRALEDRFADKVNVKDFGAKGDGLHDDTESVQKAIHHANKILGRVFFPAGEYILSKQIESNLLLNIEGQGELISRLVWDENAESAGLKLQYNSTLPYGVAIENIGLFRKNMIGGTAIDISGADGGSYPDISRGRINNVVLGGETRSSSIDTWDVGIYTTNVAGLDISSVKYDGVENEDKSNGMFHGIFLWQDDDDNNSEVSSHHWVTNCQASRAHIAIKASSSEGLYVLNYRFFNVDYGIDYDNKGQLSPTMLAPRFSLIGGHISAKIRGVIARYGASLYISGCNMLNTQNEDTYGYAHIELINCSAGIICNNLIHSNKIKAKGILLNNSTDFSIVENNFYGQGTYAITNINSRYNFAASNKVRFTWSGAVENDESSYISLVNGTNVYRLKEKVITAKQDTLTEISIVQSHILGLKPYFDDSKPQEITIPLLGTKGKFKITVMLILNEATPNSRIETDISINGINEIGSGKDYTWLFRENQTVNLKSDDIVLDGGDKINLKIWSENNLKINKNSTISLTYVGDAA